MSTPIRIVDKTGLEYFWSKLSSKLDDKVDKVAGKGLSENDFTTAYKNKLDNINNAGSATRPVYFSSGSPSVISYEINKTVPADALFTDTLNTAGSTDTSSKIYLIGSTNQTSSSQTYSQDTAYVGTDGHLYSNGKQTVNLSDTQSLTNKTINGLTLTSQATGFKISGGTTSRTLTVDKDYNLGDASEKNVDTTIAAASTSTNLPTSQAVASFVEGKNYVTVADAQTITGNKTFSGTFNYSAIPNAATNVARNVWFSDDTKVGQPVKNNNFKYNPSTNDLTVGKINGYTIETSVPSGAVFTDTTYTFATGDANGQIKVTPSNGSAQNVDVKGLGSNAYTSTAYLPLEGGTMTGNLISTDTTGRNIISVGSNNKDTTVLRIYSSDGGTATTNKGQYGYTLKYLGASSGNNNKLQLLADNQTASSQNSVFTVTNDGKMTIDQDLTTGKINGYTLNAASAKDVDTSISAASTSTKLPTSQAVASFVEGKGYITYDTTYTLTQDQTDGHVLTFTPSNGTATTITIPDNNTTYTGSNGITLTGTNFTNSGVRSIATGDNNGEIKVNTNGTNANVKVKGINDLAFIAKGSGSTKFLREDGTWQTTPDNNTTYTLTQDGTDGHKITFTPSTGTATIITIPDNNTTYTGSNGITLTGTNFTNSGVRSISTGSSNGTISVNTNGTSANVSVKGLKALAYKDSLTASDVGAIASTLKGAANGVAELDADGLVPTSQLPSYVDDIIDLLNITATAPSTCAKGDKYYNTSSNKIFTATATNTWGSTGETPESGKIYVNLNNNKTYRWSGSALVEISESLALGTTSSTAYYGDKGKTAYDHSQLTSGNPHGVTKTDVGLGNVGNFKAVSTVASQGLSSTEQSNARANIGAGTSSLTLGTSSSTAYRGDRGNTAYSHATDSSRLTTATASGLYKVASTAQGHIASLVAVTKEDIEELGIPGGDTTYGPGTGIVFSGTTVKTKIKSETASSLSAASMGSTADRQYAVGVDKDGYLSVNIPWTDTNTKVTVSNTNPTTGTWYYPIWYTSTSGTGTVNANDGFRHYSLQGTASAAGRSILQIGNATATGTAGNKYGELRIYAEKAGFATIKATASATAETVHTLPNTTGTILNTGTTSFTQSLTSGTAVGTLKINGTDTVLYAPTNTNTTYSLTQDSSDGHKITLTPSSGTAQTITIPDNNTTYTNGTGLTLTNTTFSISQANVSTILNLLSTGDSDAQAADYVIAQYAGGGTTTTTYHRKPVNKIVNSTVVKSALGTDGSTTTQYLNKKGEWATPPDTKNTAGSTDSSSKLFLIGATSQAANPQTYSQDTAYVDTNGHLYSNSKQVVNLSDTQALTNKTYNGYTLAAACAKGVVTTVDTSANLPTSNAVKTFVEGKGYSTLVLGNTATTAAAGNHTHTTTIAADSGTNALTLAASTKYKLTAGGTSFIFTTPPNTTYAFETTSTTDLGIDSTTVKSAIGYVNGLTKADWNYQQIDGCIHRQTYSDKWIHQIFGDYRTGQISVRGKNNGTWQSWRRVLDESNYSSIITGYATSGHTHNLSIATDSGTNQLSMSANTKYKLTAGGSTYIFTTPTDSDTKNTAGSTDTSSKIFLIGATSQAANPQTYSDNEVYATSGVLTTKSVQVGGTAATMQYNSTDKCIEFVFA